MHPPNCIWDIRRSQPINYLPWLSLSARSRVFFASSYVNYIHFHLHAEFLKSLLIYPQNKIHMSNLICQWSVTIKELHWLIFLKELKWKKLFLCLEIIEGHAYLRKHCLGQPREETQGPATGGYCYWAMRKQTSLPCQKGDIISNWFWWLTSFLSSRILWTAGGSWCSAGCMREGNQRNFARGRSKENLF